MTLPPEPPPPPPPQAIFALFELLKLIGLVLAFGIAQAWQQTFGALFKWLASVIDISIFHRHPFRFIAHNLEAAASRVQSFFGHLALAREPGFVTFLTWTNRVNKSQADEIAASTAESWATLKFQQQVFVPYFVKTKTKPINTSIGNVKTTATNAKTAAKNAQATATTAKTAAAHKIDKTTTVHLSRWKTTHANGQTITKAVPGSVALPIPGAIDAINDRLDRLLRDGTRLAARRSEILKLLTAAGAAGLVAMALRRWKMGWLRCPSLNRLGRKVGCGGFAFLEGLFAATWPVFVLADLCTITTAMTKAAQAFAPELEYLSSQIGGLIKCQKATRPRTLQVRKYASPPVVDSLTL